MEGSAGNNAFNPILAPGFRFYPTDQELVIHYLKEKLSSPSNPNLRVIADVDIYKFDPWELPAMAMFGEEEWFFFSPRNRKYPNGARPNRTAASGYWKATGCDKPILDSSGSQCLGVKKALVFYSGKAPKGVKTEWMMQEYRLLEDNHYLRRLGGSMLLDDWVLCRVRQKCHFKYGENSSNTLGCSSGPSSARVLHGQENSSCSFMSCDECQADVVVTQENVEAGKEQNLDYEEMSPAFSSNETNSNFEALPSFEEALESMKKVLSVGTLDELVSLPPTVKQSSHHKKEV